LNRPHARAAAGQEKYDKVRTSSGMFFKRGQNELIKRIEGRVAMVTMLPAGHAEGMQVLHYEVRCADGQLVL
jgi:prolyl 4-hydroxylase